MDRWAANNGCFKPPSKGLMAAALGSPRQLCASQPRRLPGTPRAAVDSSLASTVSCPGIFLPLIFLISTSSKAECLLFEVFKKGRKTACDLYVLSSTHNYMLVGWQTVEGISGREGKHFETQMKEMEDESGAPGSR